MSNPGFFELIPYIPVQKNTLYCTRMPPAKKPCQSAIINATTGDIPCVNPYADFQRLPQAVERQIAVVALHTIIYIATMFATFT
jgi:deoxycytidylate deaminase